jgi:hypothetical protein
LYLHELVNTVPARSEDYLDSMAEYHGRHRTISGRKDTMLGLWTVLEATGSWPLGVNLWQHATWDEEGEDLTRQFEPRSQDPELKQWWLTNLHLRTGGLDRLIEPSAYTLDVAGLRQKGVGGKLFLHQIVKLTPGRVEEYLAAFGEAGVPALEAEGAQLVGAYRVCLCNHEAIVILAFREPADLARLLRGWHEDGQPGSMIRQWREREERLVKSKESLLMRPRYFLSSPWHP